MSLDLEAIRARLAAATPGEWRHCTASEGNCACGLVWSDESILVASIHPDMSGDIPSAQGDEFAANKRLMVSAKQDISDLLAEVERVMGERDAWRTRYEEERAEKLDACVLAIRASHAQEWAETQTRGIREALVQIRKLTLLGYARKALELMGRTIAGEMV